MDSWTVTLFRRWWPYLTLPSLFRLRAHQLRDGRNEITRHDSIVLDVVRPFRARLLLREYGTDIGTMEEVVVDEVYRDVAARIPKCSTIVDLGANIGMSVLYFRSRYPDATIIALEPHPETFEILKTNVAPLIEGGNCRVLKAAIWDQDKDVQFAERVDAQYSTVLITEPAADPTSQSSVEGVSMSLLMSRYGLEEIDLLKVDIEGSEVQLFRGDTRWLTNVKAIAIEFHGDSRERSGFDPLMKHYGFRELSSGEHTVLVARL